MSEIGLQDLIYQVKRELLAPNPRARAKDPAPLFLIDNIELEISVNVSQTRGGGIKLTVLDFAEIGGEKSIARERGHVVKVSLSPLLDRDDILKEVLQDPKVQPVVEKRTREALVKSDELAGEPE